MFFKVLVNFSSRLVQLLKKKIVRIHLHFVLILTPCHDGMSNMTLNIMNIESVHMTKNEQIKQINRSFRSDFCEQNHYFKHSEGAPF